MSGNRLSATLCCGALAALMSSGCMEVSRDYPEKRHYLIEVPVAASVPAGPRAPVLKVRRFDISEGYAGKAFVYRLGHTGYTCDFYNEFFIPPAIMVTEEARRTLVASGLFRHVVDVSSHVDADYVLEGSVVSLYGDTGKRTGGKDADPAAVLEVEFFLLTAEGAGAPVVHHRRIHKIIPVARFRPADLVGGWSRALGEALAELVDDLRKLGLTAAER